MPKLKPLGGSSAPLRRDALRACPRLAALVRTLIEQGQVGDGPFEIIETHISAILLAGDRAYKFKKPVRFDFVDFSTLASRRHFCKEELRLNRRTAPGLYLEVCAIGGSEASPQLRLGEHRAEPPAGADDAIEYVLVMRRFGARALLAQRLATERGPGMDDALEALALRIAQFHVQSPRAQVEPDEYAAALERQITGNFQSLQAVTDRGADLAALEAWSAARCTALRPLLTERARNGRVRDVHGDLHLANVVFDGDRLVPFDCVEFSRSFRECDVLNDIGFLEMDLLAHGYMRQAYLLRNAYLESTGDYSGLRLSRFFLVYRAMIRAKVAHLSNSGADASDRYLSFAGQLSRVRPRPSIVLMHGLSGSGKSTAARELVAELGLIRIRTDVERKRSGQDIFAVDGGSPSSQERGEADYAEQARASIYTRLENIAEAIVGAGFAVCVDATFLAHSARERFASLARRLDVDSHIVDVRADVQTLYERLDRRAALGVDASDADRSVLQSQIRDRDPLNEEERSRMVVLQSGDPQSLQRVVAALDTTT